MTTEARVDVMERGSDRRQSTVVRASQAQRYLNMRRRALEQTHQQAINEFATTVGAQYGTVEEATRAYFARWQIQYQQSMTAYNERIKAINNDRLMDSLRKQDAIQRIRPPMYPAWSQENEDAFLGTYGDPRANIGSWNGALNALKEDQVEAQNGTDTVMYVRSAWEKFVPSLLAEPELDHSVAPCVELTPEGVAMVETGALLRATRDGFAPPVPEGTIDPEYYAAMMAAAKTVCPHCRDNFPRGYKQHEIACAAKHEEASIFAEETEAEDAPTN